MSIVEQAAKRLEQLKRAGFAVPNPGTDAANAGVAQPPMPLAQVEPTPAAAMRRLAAEAERLARTDQRVDAGHATASADPAVPSNVAALDVQRLAAAQPAAAAQLTIDLARLQDAGYLVPTSTRTLLAEEFRLLKRPLLENAREAAPAGLRSSQIMITSGLPGEGKTFFAINLAMSLAAEIDTSVLLVDADVVRPSLFARLGVPAGRGLLDLLTDAALDPRDLVCATNVPKLSILAAGTSNDKSTELLASNAMERLLSTLAQRYPKHLMIFDAPPLVLTNEAKVLASCMGQIVLVVEASKTPRSVVAQCFAALEQCPVVMSALNKMPGSASSMGYGYYLA